MGAIRWSDCRIRSILFLIATAIAIVASPLRAIAQTTYSAPDGRYTMEIPQGMHKLPVELLEPGIEAMFERPSDTDPNVSISLALQPLGQELARERLRREHIGELSRILPDATNFGIETLPWGEQRVNVITFTMTTSDGSRFAAMAQIPIRGSAVQVIVGAPVPEAETARVLLARTVASIEGEARWALPPSTSAPPQVARNARAGTALLVFAAVIFVGGLITAFEVRRRTGRGVLLMLAVVVWALGAGQAATAEAPANLLIGGTIQFLGFIAAIIGVVDLFLPRKKKVAVAKRGQVPEPPTPNDPR